MKEINEILGEYNHRPWALPAGSWTYYQEWNNALFLHWEVPKDVLQCCVPDKLELDAFEGKYYVTLVVFTMQKIRPRGLPALKFISDFHEINLRTYVKYKEKAGVYFLSIEANKLLSVFIARLLSGLPYEKSEIIKQERKVLSNNVRKKFQLVAEFETGETIATTSMEDWLVERYSLYLLKDHSLFRYQIHHKKWELKKVVMNNLTVNYSIGDYSLSERPPMLLHYSSGVKVISWSREYIAKVI